MSKRKAPAPPALPDGVAPGRGGSPTGQGQAPFVATAHQRQAVAALVSIGHPYKVISEVLRIPERTLTRHFSHELKHGRTLIHAQIGGSIVAAALSGDRTMQIFYAKAQMGWRDRHSIGFDDKDGNAINPDRLFQVSIT